MTSLRFALIGCCAWLLAACSGGGGGGGGDGGGGGGSGQFSIARNSISFEADIDGARPAPVSINGSITGVSSTVYLTVRMTNESITNATVELTGETTGRLTVFPRSPAQLGLGTFSDIVTVSACLDPACAREVSGSPKTIAVTYNVRGLRVSPSGTVNLASAEGVAAAPVEVSLQNSTAGAWTASIIYQGAANGWLDLTPTSGPVGSEQTLRLSANALTAPGTYNASVRLSSGRSATVIPVTYTVTPNLSVAPASLTLTAVTGQTAPPSSARTTVSAARGTTAFTTSISYGAGASGWLAVSGNSAPGTLSVLPQTVAFSPGVYNATVTLTPTAGGTPITVPVTYTLAPSELTFNPGTATFRINASSTNAASFVQRTVQIGDTGAPLMWSTQESSPWLQVTGSGSSGQPAQVTVLPAALETMQNGTHTATINFTYNGPSVSNRVRSLTVELTLQLPTIVYAMPYVAYLNEQKPLVLRGSGFDQAGLGPVMFDGVAAQSSEVINDTTIRVVPPSFASPARPVISIANNLGLDRTEAELVARVKPDYGSTAWDFDIGVPTGARVIYDAERDYVFSMRHFVGIDPPANTRQSVLRFSLDPRGTGAAFRFEPFPWIEDIGLSPNGKILFVLTTTQLHFVDPETLMEIAPAVTVPATDSRTDRLAVVNDGRVLLPYMGVYYQPLTNTFEPLGFNGSSSGVAVSADGSRAVFGVSVGTTLILRTYDSNTGEFAYRSGPGYLSQLSVNRSGTLIANGGEILNADFTAYGTAAAGFSTILSPVGDRLFELRFSPSRLHVFDTSSPASTLPEVRVIPGVFGPGGRGMSLNGEYLFAIDADRISVIATQ